MQPQAAPLNSGIRAGPPPNPNSPNPPQDKYQRLKELERAVRCQDLQDVRDPRARARGDAATRLFGTFANDVPPFV